MLSEHNMREKSSGSDETDYGCVLAALVGNADRDERFCVVSDVSHQRPT